MRISDWSSDVCSSDLKAGLIEPTERTASGYRVYEACDVHTLRFIRRARDLGFLVKQIQELLALWRDRGRERTDVGAVASAHIRRLRDKIAAMQSMVATLDELVDRKSPRLNSSHYCATRMTSSA